MVPEALRMLSCSVSGSGSFSPSIKMKEKKKENLKHCFQLWLVPTGTRIPLSKMDGVGSSHPETSPWFFFKYQVQFGRAGGPPPTIVVSFLTYLQPSVSWTPSLVGSPSLYQERSVDICLRVLQKSLL